MEQFLRIKSRNPSQEVGTLQVELWALYVTEGFMGAIHGDFTKIQEIYIPALRVSMNYTYGRVNVFSTDYTRYRKQNPNSLNGDRKQPELLSTVVLHGEEAAHFRNLAEVKLLFDGFQKEAAPIIKRLVGTNDDE